MRKTAAVGVAFTASALVSGTLFGIVPSALADLTGPTREHAPRTCDFERTWNKRTCTIDGTTFPWIYSRAQEQDQIEKDKARDEIRELCADDSYAQPPYTYIVRKGDTLWSIAVKTQGIGQKGGHYYKTIMRLNGMTSTKIKPNQMLQVKDLPAECAPFVTTR